MDQSQANTDCYFYYYSTCTKINCPFRHEPAALSVETVCTYWKQGSCTKPHCSFRHMLLDKKRNVMNCYWETQPSGCLKPHCPFLHDKPKEEAPYEPETVAIVPNQPPPALHTNNTIIVNKTKLGQIVLPGSNSRRVLPSAKTTSKRPVKDRLGERSVKMVEVYECTDDSEEEELRLAAKQSIDLRNRLRIKRKHDDSMEEVGSDMESNAKLRSVVHVKKAKKEKKEKKAKKEKKKKAKRDVDEESDEGSSLAARIAAQREKSKPGSHFVDRSANKSKNDYLSPSDNHRKLKIPGTGRGGDSSKVNIEEEKKSVLSVIDDVDALLKSSSGNLPISDKDSKDVMDELDEILNS